MRELEQRIDEWRKTMRVAPQVRHETLEELENHLRETVDQLVRAGMTEPEAFRRAVEQLGGARPLGSEFQKLKGGTWLPVKVILTAGILGALALALFLPGRFEGSQSGLLLASHVFLITVGYTTTFLIGALGICFVGQRCVSDLSPSETRSVTRVTFMLSCIGASLTAVGIILGAIWARVEWGRYWAWDIKEVGGLTVIVWQLCFLWAHRLACGHARAILVTSLIGNMVVSLAWFAGHLISNVHGYGPGIAWLFLGVVPNLVLFALGWAPAGWLRPRRG